MQYFKLYDIINREDYPLAFAIDSEKEIWIDHKGISHNFIDYQLQEFTGKFDLRNNPIYSGDILKSSNGKFYFVEWNNTELCWEAKTKQDSYLALIRWEKSLNIGNKYQPLPLEYADILGTILKQKHYNERTT